MHDVGNTTWVGVTQRVTEVSEFYSARRVVTLKKNKLVAYLKLLLMFDMLMYTFCWYLIILWQFFSSLKRPESVVRVMLSTAQLL